MTIAAPTPELPLTILQTPIARHLENDFYPRGASGSALCGDLLGGKVKRIKMLRIPPAAVCCKCVRIARQWCGWWYFEPWDSTQRLRLLSNLTKDLAVVGDG